MSSEYVLTLSCQDRPGVVAAVSGLLAAHGCNITESQQFGDEGAGRFFMRVQFTSKLPEADLRGLFAGLAPELAMEFRLHDLAVRPRVLVMVSKLGHCLNDLLYRMRSGLLDIEIVAVVSNHPDLRPLTQSYGIDYHHLHLVHPEWERCGEVDLAERTTWLVARYLEMSLEGGRAIGDALRLIAEAGNAPLVFHCMAGKDRTGILCALTHHLAGVHPDDIIQDYLLTNDEARIARRLPTVRARIAEASGREPSDAALQVAMRVEAEYLERAFAVMRARHGSIDGYLDEALGLTPQLRERLHDRLLG